MNQAFLPLFEEAALDHKDIIFGWLDSPHIKEFWDNSAAHRQDIVSFMKGDKEPRTYFQGIFTYWIGSLEGKPYCLVMTAEVCKDKKDYPQIWKDYLSPTGRTYSIDFCIGNIALFGKGLAAPTLEAFMQFFQENVDEKADTFFIDPDDNNPRAKHVYAKAGFDLVGDYVMEGGVFDGKKTDFMVKKLRLN
jgi:RimJ/RimL family protein N-acetyltransferase